MKTKLVFLLVIIFLFRINIISQGFDNATRALYILDISKYIKWNNEDYDKLTEFKIGILSNETALYWELINAGKTRLFIQGKQIKILHYNKIEEIEKTQVLFVGDPKEYKVGEVLKKIKSSHTLLITENCEFRLSMINFIVVQGKPRFESNEKLMNDEGMTVSQLFLAQAVKTREEWEQLFNKSEVELTAEKDTVKQQEITITDQKTQIGEQANEIEIQKKQIANLDKEISQKQQLLSVTASKLQKQENYIHDQQIIINKQKSDVEKQKNILDKQNLHIEEQKKEISESEIKIKQQNLLISEKIALIEKQKLVLGFSFILILAISFLGYFIYRSYKIKKLANIALEEKNRTILAQKAEIEEQRDIAENQRDQIAFQKRHIMDSIEYAKRIQTAILPSLELFSDKLEHFVLYKPKDIVSGDFYWQSDLGDEMIVVVADCTGHGVPGAFMSMLGVSLLNEIIEKQEVISPDEILNRLRHGIINSLKQKEKADIKEGMKDGMDVAVCSINFNKNRLMFAGANNPLYLIRNNELSEIKGDKMPVAIHSVMNPFTLHELELQKGDSFYTFSDGYSDQFGGAENKKFLSKNFRNTILSFQGLPMLQQGVRLNEIFEQWRGENEQVDDVTVVGIKY